MVLFIIQNFFFVMLTMLIVYYIINYFRDRKEFGEALYLLENQVKWLRPFTTVFLALSVISLISLFYSGEFRIYDLLNDLILILFFAFFTLQQTIPLKITEKGMYRVSQGFKWDEVVEYDFVRQQKRNKVYFLLRVRLKIKKRKGTRPYLCRYKIAGDQKKRAEQLIKKYVKISKDTKDKVKKDGKKSK